MTLRVGKKALTSHGENEQKAAALNEARNPSGMKARMVKAALWLVGSNVTSQALRLISSLVLTRLLMPDAFGLMSAMGTLYFGLVMFSDMGVWQSVVKSENGNEDRFLGTAWAAQLIRAMILVVLVCLMGLGVHFLSQSNWIQATSVYADPRMPWMMASFAICALMQGLESMKLASAQRNLQGSHLARVELMSQLVAMVVTIALTWCTRSVWSLMIGAMVNSMTKTLLSHFYLPGKNVRPCWDPLHAKEIIGFGKWIFLSSIIGFLASNIEKLILAALLSATSFGLFSIASTLLAAVVGVYASLNGHVVFPSLTQALRSHRDDMVRIYGRVQRIVDVLLGLLSGVLILSGHWAVWVLFDSRYQQAGWMLQALGWTLLALRYQVVEQLMFANNQPAWVSANNALRALGLLIAVPAGFAVWGERGALIAVVACQFASWPLSLVFKWREGLMGKASEVWWLPALIVGLLMGWGLDSLFLWNWPVHA
jgi:O-antigen/teichoic acid export membrane protein